MTGSPALEALLLAGVSAGISVVYFLVWPKPKSRNEAYTRSLAVLAPDKSLERTREGQSAKSNCGVRAAQLNRQAGMQVLALVAMTALSSGCATQHPESPPGAHTVLTDEIDCESLNPKLSPYMAARILEIANHWATRHCFLPSDLEVAVEVSEQTRTSLTLYLSLPYDVEVGPEALITMKYPQLEITKVETWHIDPDEC